MKWSKIHIENIANFPVAWKHFDDSSINIVIVLGVPSL